MAENENRKEILDYFRSNIFEALSAYNGWKMICHSRSKGILSQAMVDRYVEIQNYHPKFFVSAERAFLVAFVMLSLHSFDKRDDSFSLYKVNKEGLEKFMKDNDKVIKSLKSVRNELFAHRDNEASTKKYNIPSIIDLDLFFQNLIEFYNKLTSVIDDSSTNFANTEEIKRDIELLFMNLYRGDAIRKREVDIKWLWEQDNKKASDIL